jgi:predicted AAA+ superfamily ATPase
VEALPGKRHAARPLVLLDEVQKVPVLLDVVQDLIDRGLANFVLTGSSARKLRRGKTLNLLPGILASEAVQDRETDLESYVTIYPEEEVRAEAIVSNIGPFARFLEYAASESGQVVNLRKLSQEIGVSHTTIRSYYEILEDCLIVERVEPLTKSRTRKKLTKAQKYLCACLSRKKVRILFWRDPDGPEVDWVVEREGRYTPVEVKWTDNLLPKEVRHLQTFLSEYPSAEAGYLVCQVRRKAKLSKGILALPWQEVDGLVL